MTYHIIWFIWMVSWWFMIMIITISKLMDSLFWVSKSRQIFTTVFQKNQESEIRFFSSTPQHGFSAHRPHRRNTRPTWHSRRCCVARVCAHRHNGVVEQRTELNQQLKVGYSPLQLDCKSVCMYPICTTHHQQYGNGMGWQTACLDSKILATEVGGPTLRKWYMAIQMDWHRPRKFKVSKKSNCLGLVWFLLYGPGRGHYVRQS